jgi:hypothetical protein
MKFPWEVAVVTDELMEDEVESPLFLFGFGFFLYAGCETYFVCVKWSPPSPPPKLGLHGISSHTQTQWTQLTTFTGSLLPHSTFFVSNRAYLPPLSFFERFFWEFLECESSLLNISLCSNNDSSVGFVTFINGMGVFTPHTVL